MCVELDKVNYSRLEQQWWCTILYTWRIALIASSLFAHWAIGAIKAVCVAQIDARKLINGNNSLARLVVGIVAIFNIFFIENNLLLTLQKFQPRGEIDTKIQ